MEANRTDCWLTWNQPIFLLSVLSDWHMPIIKSICSSCLCPCCMCSMLSTKSQRFRQQQAAPKAHGPWKRNFNSLSPRRPGSEIVSGLWVAVEKWVKFLHYSVVVFFTHRLLRAIGHARFFCRQWNDLGGECTFLTSEGVLWLCFSSGLVNKHKWNAHFHTQNNDFFFYWHYGMLHWLCCVCTTED